MDRYEPVIPKDQLIHGMYYRGRCRNADIARWNGEKKCFLYRRHKFGHSFIEEIKCPEDDQVYDVFIAEELIATKEVTEEMVIPFRDF